MSSDLKLKNYLPVNWIDGMKINEQHLKNLELSIYDQINDTAGIALSNFNYGVLAPKGENNNSIDLKSDFNSANLISACLRRCHAVTRSGARIEITNEIAMEYQFMKEDLQRFTELKADFNADRTSSENYFIVVNINPFKRIPVGQPDREEEPPRLPFTIPSYSLGILPVDHLNVDANPEHLLPIGKITLANGKFSLDKNYIPPCCAVKNHDVLQTSHDELGDLVYGTEGIREHMIRIIQNIKERKQESRLALNIYYIADKMVFFTTDEFFRYKNVIAESPPVFMIDYFVRIAYLVQTCLDCIAGEERKKVYEFLSEWAGMSSGDLETKLLINVIKIKYNHFDISGCIVPIKKMLDSLNDLFRKLADNVIIGPPERSGPRWY